MTPPQTVTHGTASPARLTVSEAAARLGCNPETVRRAIRAGKLPASRPLGSRGLLIRLDDLERVAS